MWAAHTRGIAAWFRRDYPQARKQLELALGRAGELVADPRPAVWPLTCGVISVEPEAGYPLVLHEDTAAIARRVGGAAAAAHILVNLAAVDRAEGDFARAGELVEESVERFQRLADVHGEALRSTPRQPGSLRRRLRNGAGRCSSAASPCARRLATAAARDSRSAAWRCSPPARRPCGGPGGGCPEPHLVRRE